MEICGVVSVAVLFSVLFILGFVGLLILRRRPFYQGGPLNLEEFNRLFVAANDALRVGDTDALKSGIGLLIDSLAVAGDFAKEIVPAISALHCALSHHDRADTKYPWNRDLSGYGLHSWRNDLCDRDAALQRAWPHIKATNDQLRAQGLGWRY